VKLHQDPADRTTIRTLARRVLVNDAPGGHQAVLDPGDRVEVGGPAANGAYLIAYRMQRTGEGWVKLGPFATVPAGALEDGRVFFATQKRSPV
jgi:hypothetical protein